MGCVPEGEMQAALKSSSRELRSALETAAGTSDNFANGRNLASGCESRDGISLGQLVRPSVRSDATSREDDIRWSQLC